MFNRGDKVDLSELGDCHLSAVLMKLFLRELPEPLLTFRAYASIVEIRGKLSLYVQSLWCVVCGVWCVVCGVWCVVWCVWCGVVWCGVVWCGVVVCGVCSVESQCMQGMM